MNHIAHLTGLVEVTPTAFNPDFLSNGNFHVIDSAVIPVVHKQGVGKAQRQQVQNRFFTQIVVNTINLALFKIFAHLVVNLAGSFQRSAQRFFHDDARRFSVQLRFTQTAADGAKGAWWHSEVVDGGAIFLIEHLAKTRKCWRIVDIEVAEVKACAEGVPQTFINLLFHEGFERFADNLGVCRFIPVGTADADNPGVRINLASFFQLIQGRQQFPAGQVALRAENDQIACLGRLRYRHVILLSLYSRFYARLSTRHRSAFAEKRRISL